MPVKSTLEIARDSVATITIEILRDAATKVTNAKGMVVYAVTGATVCECFNILGIYIILNFSRTLKYEISIFNILLG